MTSAPGRGQALGDTQPDAVAGPGHDGAYAGKIANGDVRSCPCHESAPDDRSACAELSMRPTAPAIHGLTIHRSRRGGSAIRGYALVRTVETGDHRRRDSRVIDRAGLAQFLRRRRESLQPRDVGLPGGRRRRTSGLRREEVASLCHMSTDYYARLERERGPHPSEQMIASIAQGLHLSRLERDHLFRLAGHHPPTQGTAIEHISPGMLRILDRLQDTPAEIVSEMGETLRQNTLGIAADRRHDDLCRSGPQHRLSVVHQTRNPHSVRPRGPPVPVAHVRIRCPGDRHSARPRLTGGASGRSPPRGERRIPGPLDQS